MYVYFNVIIMYSNTYKFELFYVFHTCIELPDDNGEYVAKQLVLYINNS